MPHTRPFRFFQAFQGTRQLLARLGRSRSQESRKTLDIESCAAMEPVLGTSRLNADPQATSSFRVSIQGGAANKHSLVCPRPWFQNISFHGDYPEADMISERISISGRRVPFVLRAIYWTIGPRGEIPAFSISIFPKSPRS